MCFGLYFNYLHIMSNKLLILLAFVFVLSACTEDRFPDRQVNNSTKSSVTVELNNKAEDKNEENNIEINLDNVKEEENTSCDQENCDETKDCTDDSCVAPDDENTATSSDTELECEGEACNTDESKETEESKNCEGENCKKIDQDETKDCTDDSCIAPDDENTATSSDITSDKEN